MSTTATLPAEGNASYADSHGRDFSDWVSPILVKELRQGLKSRVFVATFIIVQVVMILLVGMLAWTVRYALFFLQRHLTQSSSASRRRTTIYSRGDGDAAARNAACNRRSVRADGDGRIVRARRRL